MFFSHFVLAKKGPLARIWLAAHWDKKLTKAHILEINIERSVEGILQPKIKLALRTSGHLLLGVVRIYSRKAKYLLAECNEAFVKIKMAFRPGMVDLPEGNREAALAAITLPEVFHDFENINSMTLDVNQTALHQSRAEDITLKEDYGPLSLMAEDAFGEMGFDDPEIARDATNIDEGFDQTGLLVVCEKSQEKATENVNGAQSAVNREGSLVNGDINDSPENPGDALSAAGADVCLYESGLFTDAPSLPLDGSGDNGVNGSRPEGDQPMDMSDDDTYCCPPSIGPPSGPSSPESVADHPQEPQQPQPDGFLLEPSSAQPLPPPPPPPAPLLQLQSQSPQSDGSVTNGQCLPSHLMNGHCPPAHQMQNSSDQPPMLMKDSETFPLAPVESAIIIHRGTERTKSKRKRKLIVDEVKNISGEEMKAQLSDTRDIISTLDLAPPTKRLMHWKESGGVEKLFALPGHTMQSKVLSKLYLRHLTTRSTGNESFETDETFPALEEMRTKTFSSREAPTGAPPSKKQRLEEQSAPSPPPAQPAPQVPSEPEPIETAAAAPLPPQPPLQLPEPAVAAVAATAEPPAQAVPGAECTGVAAQPVEAQMAQETPTILPDVDPFQAVAQEPENVQLPAEEAQVTVPTITSDPEPAPEEKKEDAVVANADECNNNDADKVITSSTEALFDELSSKPASSLEPEQDPSAAAAVATAAEAGETAPLEPDAPTESAAPQSEPERAPASMILAMDDDDDYQNPASIGAEEQMMDETYEQFEERVHSKRASHMLRVMRANLEAGYRIPFSALTKGSKRKQVAQKFYTCLVLKKQQAIELEQAEAYAEVYITSGPHLEAVFQ